MDLLIGWTELYGLAFIALNVFMSQAGLPLPAYPSLIIAGAILVPSRHSLAIVLLCAVAAAFLADLGWYGAGVRLGRRVLKQLCRISLSPDGCVRQTETIYQRFGPASLTVAKFIPGFAAVATAMAGALRTTLWKFTLFDALGAALWAGAALGLGMLFRDAIRQLLRTLAELGQWGSVLVLFALAVFVATKWWERRRFIRELRMARISVEELRALLEGNETPVILDVRSPSAQGEQGRIPGSIAISHDTLDASLDMLSGRGEVIVYCACPNEASAAHIAKLLMLKGFERVRPLAGGIDAWIAAGYGVEHEPSLASEAARESELID